MPRVRLERISLLLFAAFSTSCAAASREAVEGPVSGAESVASANQTPAPVADVTISPFRSICHLTVRRRGSEPTSTGALLAQTQLLTAAHNVYSPAYNRISDGRAECGRDGTTAAWTPRETFGARDQRAAAGYFWRVFRRDYALVRLSTAAPYPADFRLLRPDEAAPVTTETVHVAGYPGTSGRMHHASGRVREVSRGLIHYTVDTNRGMSGSPVWVEREGEYVIVGVHVSEVLPTRRAPGYAIARLIEPNVHDEIVGWMRTHTEW